MRSRMLCVACLSALVAGGFLLSPAAAQSQSDNTAASRPTARKPPPKKPAAHITVQRRSFLDAGTEVLPGQRKFLDYAFPPGYSPTAVIDYTGANPTGPHSGIDPYARSGRPLTFGW
jgi:hypothetical protein